MTGDFTRLVIGTSSVFCLSRNIVHGIVPDIVGSKIVLDEEQAVATLEQGEAARNPKGIGNGFHREKVGSPPPVFRPRVSFPDARLPQAICF